jgi:hypothetical protein
LGTRAAGASPALIWIAIGVLTDENSGGTYPIPIPIPREGLGMPLVTRPMGRPPAAAFKIA